MNYSAYSPPIHVTPWQDLFSYDSSDTGSIDHTSSRPPSITPSETAHSLPAVSLQQTRKRSRRSNTQGPLNERVRDRIKELEQRIRELESSASETTARATIKVLQTRVRDLEAEVDCLTMRLGHAERAMTRTLAEGAKPVLPQNLFTPVTVTPAAISVQGVVEAQNQNPYIATVTSHGHPAFTLSPPADLPMASTALVDPGIPRSANAATRPLVHWDDSPVSVHRRTASATVQRPVLAAQQTAVWHGAGAGAGAGAY